MTQATVQNHLNSSVEQRPVWWRGCLNWLVLLLLLALIFLVIYCCLFDRCDFCYCPDPPPIVPTEIPIPPPPEPLPAPEPEAEPEPPPPPPPPPSPPCIDISANGGDEGYVGSFELGTSSGTFVFRYNTHSVPDSISIYEGLGVGGRVIYRYAGRTIRWRQTTVSFNQQIITVEVIGLGVGTVWDFHICAFGIKKVEP